MSINPGPGRDSPRRFLPADGQSDPGFGQSDFWVGSSRHRLQSRPGAADEDPHREEGRRHDPTGAAGPSGPVPGSAGASPALAFSGSLTIIWLRL